jgi:plastocyanin
MRYIVFTTLAFIAVFFLISQDANAQVTGNKAFSLTGNGFATSSNSISETRVDLLFTTNQVKDNISFVLQNGLVTINDKDLKISDFNGVILKNGNYLRFSSKVTDSNGNQFTFNALGRLVDTTSIDSVYSFTGTLSDTSKIVTKLIFTTKITQLITKINEKTQTPSQISIKILKGSANPNEITYKEQRGIQFNYFSDSRVTISSGTTIIFINEDIASHSLKSGTAKSVSTHKSFTADGKFSSGVIQPGQSWSVTFNESGFYRLFDEKYQWMDMTVFVIPSTTSQVIGSNITPLN